jgi:hypothetical protein
MSFQLYPDVSAVTLVSMGRFCVTPMSHTQEIPNLERASIKLRFWRRRSPGIPLRSPPPISLSLVGGNVAADDNMALAGVQTAPRSRVQHVFSFAASATALGLCKSALQLSALIVALFPTHDFGPSKGKVRIHEEWNQTEGSPRDFRDTNCSTILTIVSNSFRSAFFNRLYLFFTASSVHCRSSVPYALQANSICDEI